MKYNSNPNHDLKIATPIPLRFTTRLKARSINLCTGLIFFGLFFNAIVSAKDNSAIPASLLKEVENGNAEIAYFIAQTYLEGNESYEKDAEKAMHWLEKSATMGYAHAMNAIADEFNNSNEKEKALKWYQQAAENGVGEAFSAIANYYLTGEAGLEKSCSNAYEWFEKAELRNVKLAFNNHAWTLATSTEKQCRNPEKALVIYSRLKTIYREDNESIPWSYWDTEAAILASISDFSAAIKLQQWLIKEVQSYDMDITIYQQHLDAYVQRKPWYEGENL